MSDFENRYIQPNSERDLLISSLRKIKAPSADDICKTEGVTPEELPDLLSDKLKGIFAHCKENASIIDDELNSQIDFVYQCYEATKNVDASSEFYELSAQLKDFESFISVFAKGVDRKTLGNFMQRVDRFIQIVVHPKRIMKAWPEGHRMKGFYEMGIYKHEGAWVPLEHKRWSGVEYIELGLLKEIIDLKESGYMKPGLYHTTGSATLDGISKQKAILSAREAIKREEEVKTGEYNTYIGHDNHSVSGRKQGLGDVHVSRSLHTGYTIARWFNEYPLAFGIAEERTRKHLKEIDEKSDTAFINWAGEGIRLGPEIPLDLVDVIYCEQIYLDKLKQWVSKNTPHAKVVSIEAHELLLRKDGLGQGKINDWNALLKKDAIIVE